MKCWWQNLIRKDFHIEVIHNNSYVSTKVTFYGGENRTDYYDDGLPLEKTTWTHSVNLIDSVYRSGKSYYPHVLLEECKCTVVDTAIKRYTRFFSKSFNKKLSLKKL